MLTKKMAMLNVVITADVFDPERFIDSRVKKYLTPNPFIFLPFNAGPRICLGQQFAYHETSYFLIRLLQQFQSISLDLSVQPEWAAPPKEWKMYGVGTQKTDKIRMKSYLTMSVVVCSLFFGLYVCFSLKLTSVVLRVVFGLSWKRQLIVLLRFD